MREEKDYIEIKRENEKKIEEEKLKLLQRKEKWARKIEESKQK